MLSKAASEHGQQAGEVAAGSVGPALHLLSSLDSEGPRLASNLDTLLAKLEVVDEAIAKGKVDLEHIDTLTGGDELLNESKAYNHNGWDLLHKAGDMFDWGAEKLTGHRPMSFILDHVIGPRSLPTGAVNSQTAAEAMATAGEQTATARKDVIQAARENMELVQGHVKRMRGEVVDVQRQMKEYQLTRSNMANYCAVLGGAISFGWASYQVYGTWQMCKEHEAAQQQVAAELDTWKSKFDTLRNGHVLDVKDIMLLVTSALDNGPEAAQGRLQHWMDEYKDLQLAFSKLQLELADIQNTIAAKLGEANGKVSLHFGGQVSSGLNVALNGGAALVALTNPWLWGAALLHAGAFALNTKGKHMAQEKADEWKALQDISDEDRKTAVEAVQVCEAITMVLKPPSTTASDKTMQELVADEKAKLEGEQSAHGGECASD